jgi:AbrB family looped-hinge helix DNA binding protein
MLERKIDDIGRLLIPVDIRKKIGLEPGDKVRLSIDKGKLIVRKPNEKKQCRICGANILSAHETIMGLCAECEEDILDRFKQAVEMEAKVE